GLAFFLKFAFDRNWIGPPMRIAMGAMLGVAALVGGEHVRRRGLAAFGHALMGGGLGALYLTNFFAAVRYGFFERPLAFAIAAGITALGAVLAIRRDAALLAHLGFFGGFLAPAVLGEHLRELGPLAAWLMLLDLGLLVVLWFRPWRGFELSALISSLGYFAHWRGNVFVNVDALATATSIAGITLALIATSLVPAIAARRTVSRQALWTAGIAGLYGFVAALDALGLEHRNRLGGGLVLFAVFYFVAARLLARRVPHDRDGREVVDLFGLGLLALAVPIVFRGDGIAPAWAIAGVVTIAVWRHRRQRGFDVFGVLMLAAALVRLASHHLPLHRVEFVPVFNGAFLTFALVFVAWVVGGRMMRATTTDSGAQRWAVGGVLMAVALWAFAALLSTEAWQFFSVGHVTRQGRAEFDPDAREAARMAGGLTLAAYTAVMAWVLRRRGVAPRDASATLFPPVFATLVFAVVIVCDAHSDSFVPGLNELFASAVAIVATTWVMQRWLTEPSRGLARYGALVAGLVVLGGEWIAYAELGQPDSANRADLRFFAQLGISISWALYAAVLIGIGFRRALADLRWAGLAAFALTLGKVFVVDMAGLDAAYRIGSFLALGVLLVAASALYQRMRPQPVN
ncbi:MAG: DUF2339 domain-containing protein, partial [Planctomycetes bacterium]|nr:DUF2339 domain-containing protein [Planctomycetota bacterium]MCC7170803.1 DUF2339 domain-containing protein [Planctomycetota bacterium]